MSLIITFMFEPAKLQMNWANASGSSTSLPGTAGDAMTRPSSAFIGATNRDRTETVECWNLWQGWRRATRGVPPVEGELRASPAGRHRHVPPPLIFLG